LPTYRDSLESINDTYLKDGLCDLSLLDYDDLVADLVLRGLVVRLDLIVDGVLLI
jgi:hypothetical protein